MSQAEPHFVRCLKPNRSQKAGVIDTEYMLAQLSYTGMLQTVQIRRDGFAFRPLIEDFVAVYKVLLRQDDLPDNAETCKRIINSVDKLQITDWHVGRTKVLLKQKPNEILMEQLDSLTRKTVIIQAAIRGFIARSSVRKLKAVSISQVEQVIEFMVDIASQSKILNESQAKLKNADEERHKESSSRENLRSQCSRKIPPQPAVRHSFTQPQTDSPQLETSTSHTPSDSQTRISPALPSRPVKPSQLHQALNRRSTRSVNDPLPSLPVSELRDTSPQRSHTEIVSQLQMTDTPPVLPMSPVIRQHQTTATQPASQPFRRISCRPHDERQKAFEAKIHSLGYSANENDDENGVQEDDFSLKPETELKYGPEGTRMASINWFRATQLAKLRKGSSNEVYEWLHGIVPRGRAEKQLLKMSVGSFMIRLSEKRLGYVLSFRAEDRCRHYMVDPTPSNKYVVVGEPKVHPTLKALVELHSHKRLSNWNGFLVDPCGQSDPSQPDYAELLPRNNKSNGSQTSHSGDGYSNQLRTPSKPINRTTNQTEQELEPIAPPLPPKLHTPKPTRRAVDDYS